MTCPNIILIEKKLSTDSFVSDDPCVFEPVRYEMMVGNIDKCFFTYRHRQTSSLSMVGKVYYAHVIFVFQLLELYWEASKNDNFGLSTRDA